MNGHGLILDPIKPDDYVFGADKSLSLGGQRDAKGHFVKGHTGYRPWLGKRIPKAVRARISQTLKDMGASHVSHRPEVRAAMSKRMLGNKYTLGYKHSADFSRKISERVRGALHPMWKGGVSKQPGYLTPYSRNYKARKRGAAGSHTPSQWDALKVAYNHMCLCCKQQEPFIKLSADHIIPLALGGSNDIGNIQPLCTLCNSRKLIKTTNYINNTTMLV